MAPFASTFVAACSCCAKSWQRQAEAHHEFKEQFMKDDYLWDGSGEPDPKVQKLETALGRYRHNQPSPKFDEVVAIRPVKRRWSFFNLRCQHQLPVVSTLVLLSATLFPLVPQAPN